MADKLDIEEQNKLRAALGMQPLPTSSSNGIGSSSLNFKTKKSRDDDISEQDEDTEEDTISTLEKRQAAASSNWQKLNDEAEAKKQRDARREALKKERDNAQRFAKLEGKGLGEASDDDVDTRSWLLGSNKRQKKIQKRRTKLLEAELAERENQALYTNRDLKGKKVGHEIGDFEEGEQILTLKDAAVDTEDDEDELENIDLKEKERLNERLKLKKRKLPYDPNDIDESGERKILAQYDEEIDGKPSKRFTLGNKGQTKERYADNESVNDPRSIKFSLDFLQDDKPPTSDYMDISEIKIKKPKKKKDKSSKRQRIHEEEENMFPTQESSNNMDIDATLGDGKATSTRNEPGVVLGDDDDDLQASLAIQRRKALKKRKVARPEELAQQFREEASATPMDITAKDDEEEGGLIIDETTEFVSNLQKPQIPETRSSDSRIKHESQSPYRRASPESDDDMDVDIAQVKREALTPDHEKSADKLTTATGLEDEKTVSQGIGSTLSLLTSRGLLKVSGTGDLNAEHRERQRFLYEKQKREEDAERRAKIQRERDRASGKFERMSVRERENYAQQENNKRDQADSRHMAEIFNREYKPQIELKYIDDAGRSMNQKEAFKHLSHQFHGKGSGKQKTEKRIKKIEDEKKANAQSSLSAEVGGIGGAAGDRARKNREAGVRLQ